MLSMYFLALASLVPFKGNATDPGASDSATRLFQSLYDGLTQAYLHRDATAAAKYFAPDYMAGTFGHPFDKKRTLLALKDHKSPFKTTARKLLTVVVNGDKASTTADSYTEGTLSDQGGHHHYLIRSRCLDSWVHNPAGWQIRRSKVVRNFVTKDGKPLELTRDPLSKHP